MAQRDRAYLYSVFRDGDIPDQEDFEDIIDSYPNFLEGEVNFNRTVTQTGVPLADASTTAIVVGDDVITYTVADATTLAFTVSGGSNTSESTAKRIIDNSANTNAVSLTWSDASSNWTWDDAVATTGPSGLAAGGIYVLEIEVESTARVFASLTPKAV